jgi:hypothetical protein
VAAIVASSFATSALLIVLLCNEPLHLLLERLAVVCAAADRPAVSVENAR